VAIDGDDVSVDFRTYYEDAESVLDGSAPLSPYPPLIPLLVAPLTALPLEVVEVIAALLMLACIPAILWVLEVRDWRCYAATLLWAPVFSAVQTGNVSLPLTLGVALAYRWRDDAVRAGIATGVTIAAKLYLWPVALWLAARGRMRALAWTVGAAAAVSLAGWAIVGLGEAEQFGDDFQSDVESLVDRAYTITSILRDVGASPAIAYGVCWAVGAALLVAGARTRDDARSLTLFLAAALVLSPIVWVHYLVALLVPLALLRPRFGPLWLAPLPLWFTPVTDGTVAERVVLLGVLAAMVAACVLSRRPWPS
jgi:Glycosyltransferase family 87